VNDNAFDKNVGIQLLV